MGLGERLEAFGPRRGELQPDDSVVLGIADPFDQLGRHGPVHQTDRAVMAQEQIVGRFADGRATAVRMSTDGEEQLMLCGRQTRFLRLLLAPAEEATESGPQGQQVFVVGIPQNHRLTIAS